MNTKLLLIAVASVSLSSCSSVYKSGQTPDDVYYSPVRMYGTEEKKEDDRKDDTKYDSKTYAEKTQIRLGINDSRWRYLDDFSYTPYSYGFNYGYYYNPYYCILPVYSYGTIVAVNPKNSTPRMTNLAAYNTAYNNNNLNANSKYYSPVNAPVRSYNNSKLSNTLNRLFNNSNYNNSNNSQYNSNQSSRSYTPSSSSRSSGSSSGGGAVSRPVRNGKG